MKLVKPGYDDRSELVGRQLTCDLCHAVAEIEKPDDVDWRERNAGRIVEIQWECPDCRSPQHTRIKPIKPRESGPIAKAVADFVDVCARIDSDKLKGLSLPYAG